MKWLAAVGLSKGRHDFSGKTLVVYSNSENSGGVLQDARLVAIGFNHFIVGRRVELEPSPSKCYPGVTIWIAVHNVAHMMIFDNLEAARRAFRSDHPEGKSSSAIPGSGEV